MNKIKMIGTGRFSIVPMREFVKGKFTFGAKAIIQIVSSARYAVDAKEHGIKQVIKTTDFTLLAKFAIVALEHSYVLGFNTSAEDDDLFTFAEFEIELISDDLQKIKFWLQAKHDHCERNQDSPEFNQETFYLLKDLILSIREFLIPQFPSRDEEMSFKSNTKS